MINSVNYQYFNICYAIVIIQLYSFSAIPVCAYPEDV